MKKRISTMTHRMNPDFFLWAHLVSEHSLIPYPNTHEESDLIDLHEHEHDGPGTIRNHPREKQNYSLSKMGEVLLTTDDRGEFDA